MSSRLTRDNQSSDSIKTRSVISVLLFPNSSASQILLFRRSSQVRTYQHKLSPIAGSIESSDPNPIAATWRELQEETGLGPSDIELWRRGIGFEFTDESARRGWKVWPFAFRFRKGVDEKNIKIDWEHVGFQWKTVEDVLSGRIQVDCVPRLETTVSQLWIDPQTVLGKVLEDLNSDHEHGARQLATKAVEGLVQVVNNGQHFESVQTWWKDLRRQAFHLAINARPSMGAAISAAIITALGRIKEAVGQPERDADVRDKAVIILKRYIEERSEIITRVGQQLSNILGELHNNNQNQSANSSSLELGSDNPRNPIRILTLSNSSTVKSSLIHALTSNPTLQINLSILESRPLYEGVSLAKSLVHEARNRLSSASSQCFHSRLHITLTPDSSVALLVRSGLDLVLLGADRISASGNVSNKVGSLPAVLTARGASEKTKPRVITVSETDKIVSERMDHLGQHEEEENDEIEVIQGWKLNLDPEDNEIEADELWRKIVRVRNVYFEWVPAEYIDGYLCEEGLWSRKEVRERAETLDELFHGVFRPEVD